jgi:hypothetical protein
VGDTVGVDVLGGKDGAPENDGKSVGCCVAVGKFVGLYDGE